MGCTAMDEFELIRRYFGALAPGGADAGVILGIGDDCALLQPPPGEVLALTTDMLVEGRHFAVAVDAADLGWKSLAVNLSDLAAMGAEPRWFTLALSLPQADPLWLSRFAAGLGEAASAGGIALVGGDTTRGPLTISITAAGSVPPAAALRRSGARAGDLVCVTGTLGDAAAALQGYDDAAGWLSRRLHRPVPRLAEGRALRELANAAIDLSDGLAGDLRHVLRASGVGARIDVEALPQSAAFAACVPPAHRLELQIAGGDDYELCLCLPPRQLEAARAACASGLTVIGALEAGEELLFVDRQGRARQAAVAGYRHFS